MNSFIGWIGGKKLLREKIANEFPKSRIERYVEVFGGAAWVLFYKEKYANQEVYNDYNSELVNLFRCVKYHRQELQRELQYFLNSREMFQDFLAQYNLRGMTDIHFTWTRRTTRQKNIIRSNSKKRTITGLKPP